MLQIKVRRVRPHPEPVPLPAYRTEGSAGMDLHADVDVDLTLAPLARSLVPTGLIFELPDGYEGQIRPRSGLALKHGITCLNAPGTLDADFRGEVQVLLVNLGAEPFVVKRGERVAQLVIAPVTRVSLTEVEIVSETVRGAGGFGSTGR